MFNINLIHEFSPENLYQDIFENDVRGEMNTNKYKLLCIALLLAALSCVVAVDAYGLVQVPEDMPWLSATGSDSATITVHLIDTLYGTDVPGKNVTFNITYGTGTLSQKVAVTNETGYATTIFTTGTKSCEAIIRAELEEDPGVAVNIIQPIDHAAPKFITVYYSNVVPVAENISIIVKMYDQYGNPVDNLRELNEDRPPEEVYFSMSSPNGTGYFTGSWEGVEYNGTTIFNSVLGLPVNSSGIIEMNLKMDVLPGKTHVIIDPLPSTVSSVKYIDIEGYAGGTPAVMDQSVNPAILYQPADGNPESIFSITYWLYDEFGNPLNGKDIHITTSLNEEFEVTTSADGSAVILYGPKNDPGYVTLTANALESIEDNPPVSRSCVVEFYDSTPVYMGISAIPGMVPSLDIGNNVNSTVKVKITDSKGMPVSGEQVNFSINNTQIYSGNQTSAPYLDSSYNMTNENGFAIVHFIPGAFVKVGEEGYDGAANASSVVEASWNNKTEDITINYKNFPFLSIYTSVTSENITIGDTVDVTIQVRGEGLPTVIRKKVNVVLLTSRAASMLKGEPDDRMVFTYQAEHVFIDKLMNSHPIDGPDQVGLLTQGGNPAGVANVSYTQPGWSAGDAGLDQDEEDDSNYTAAHYPGNGLQEYNDYATWEQTPTENLALLKQKINFTTPCSSTNKNANQNELPLRLGLYESIKQLYNSSYETKAVIVLVDSEITDYGDVLAEGSADYNWHNMAGCTERYYPFNGPDPNNRWHPWDKKDKLEDPNQNLASFANNYGVKIYVIYTADQLDNCDETTLKTLATQTGGNFNNTGGDPSKIPEIYSWIADQIMNEAGVETQMAVDMGTLEMNGAFVTYDPDDPVNTSVFDYIYEPGVSTLVRNYYKNNTVIEEDKSINQTDDFYDDHILHFYLGTIHLDQIWQATYRLRSLVNGTVKVPGPNTNITTNVSGVNFTYDISDEFVTVEPDLSTAPPTYDLIITDFSIAPESRDVATLDWTLAYTGPDANTVLSKLYYKNDEGIWILIASRHGLSGSVIFDTGSLPEGILELKLVASAERAPTRYAFPSTIIPFDVGGVLDPLSEIGKIILQ